MYYEPKCSVNFRILKELVRARGIGTSIKQTTNSRKVPYTSYYEQQREIKEKKVIDEINRQNLTSDYGV